MQLFPFYCFQKIETESQNGNAKPRASLTSERNNSLADQGCGTGLGNATPGGAPTRSRPSSKMTKYVECWGADKPFANIAESTLAKNIELTVSIYHLGRLALILCCSKDNPDIVQFTRLI